MPEVRTWLSVLIAALVAFVCRFATHRPDGSPEDRRRPATGKLVVGGRALCGQSDCAGILAGSAACRFGRYQRRREAVECRRRQAHSHDRPSAASTIGYPQQVTAVAFTPDGRRLVTAAGTIRTWDAETGRLIHNFEESFGTSAVLAVSSDGLRLVAGSNDATAREWDIASGRKVKDYVNDLGGGPISCCRLLARSSAARDRP